MGNQENISFAVNGLQAICRKGLTLEDYLVGAELEPHKVLVEINGQILRAEAFGTYELNAGDQVEIIHFVGGG
ncbi:MAG: sulfur carrier protein ThiS [Deltaproteobacteria bacterium]|jgi:thiamine biosynthesis protein ThiS|nr:sulfur carrier protein ThiS [Deltaproteobacteria bacterium]